MQDDVPDPDDLAGLAWYKWQAVKSIRRGNGPEEEKALVLAYVEKEFRRVAGDTLVTRGCPETRKP